MRIQRYNPFRAMSRRMEADGSRRTSPLCSATLPEFRVFLHSMHVRQLLCQSPPGPITWRESRRTTFGWAAEKKRHTAAP